MEQLIHAALAHARFLRKGAKAGDDCIARAAEKEAERWEALAAIARAELESGPVKASGQALADCAGASCRVYRWAAWATRITQPTAARIRIPAR
jgi:hypothetical protein